MPYELVLPFPNTIEAFDYWAARFDYAGDASQAGRARATDAGVAHENTRSDRKGSDL